MQSVSLLSGKLIVTYLKDAIAKFQSIPLLANICMMLNFQESEPLSGFGGKKDESKLFIHLHPLPTANYFQV